MTFQEWLSDLIAPEHLLTETIYNVTFEIIATVVFVKLSLKKILKKELKKHGINVED
jgi:hypothetical protein